MKDLKEISKYTLSVLNEGLLADMEDMLDSGDKYMAEEELKKFATNDKCKMTKKKNGYLLRGNFKMKDVGTTYNGPKIVGVVGNFSVSDTKLSSLEGIFAIDAQIEGTFTIENNDNLVSLKGCPISVSTLVIANNKNLKDIDIAPNVLVNAYISKNGKKFKEEYLRDKINVYKKIFCAVESNEDLVNESEMINEAFKAPQLKLVANAIKKATGSNTRKEDKFSLIRINEIPWDKIEASQISEYDNSDPKTITTIRGLVYKHATGMFVMMNAEGNVYGIIYNKHYISLTPATGGRYGSIDKYTSGHKYSAQDIIDSVSHADTFMFIDMSEMERVYKLRNDRREARIGALALQRGYERTGKGGEYSWQLSDIIDAKQVRYYQDIADSNRARYQSQLIQLKAKKALLSGAFNNIKKRLDTVFARYTALLSKIYSNPEKYSPWDIEWLNDRFFRADRGKYSVVEYGLFRAIEVYFGYLTDAVKGDRYTKANEVGEKIKKLEESIIKGIEDVEFKLNEIENK